MSWCNVSIYLSIYLSMRPLLPAFALAHPLLRTSLRPNVYRSVAGRCCCIQRCLAPLLRTAFRPDMINLINVVIREYNYPSV
jgi:hypothetical protein